MVECVIMQTMSNIEVQNKLDRLFCKLLDNSYKPTSNDELYMRKILTHLSGKSSYIKDLPVCTSWIQRIVSAWKPKIPESHLASFFLHFTGMVIGNEAQFELLQRCDTVGQLCNLIKQQQPKTSCVKQAYVAMLSDLLKHECGTKWITNSSIWKDVLNLCYDSSSIYVKRESQIFIVEILLGLAISDQKLLTNIISEILQPLFLKNNNANGQNQITDYEQTLELAIVFTESFLTKNASKVLGNIFGNINLEQLAWNLLLSFSEDKDQRYIDAVTKLLTLIYFVSIEYKEKENKILPSAVKILEKNIYKLLALHISKNNVTNVMGIVTHCQRCWSKISANVSQEKTDIKYFDFDTQLIVFQLLPILLSLQTKFEENECLESYSVKLFQLTSEGTQRLAYTYRDVLVVQPNKYDLSHRAVLNVIQLKDIFHKRIAIISYQALMYYLKDFVSEEPSKDGLIGADLIAEHPEQLGAVLDCLISVIHNFQITWRESVETICLFGFAQHLLKNKGLSPKLAVKSLKLMQVAIQNFMPPNLALLTNTLKGSSIDQLGSILHERMHDVNWEVRDTAVEVLEVVSSIADVKFPAFQEHILENGLCALILSLAMNDAEGFVRASAIKCLSAMVKVQKFWNEYLSAQELPEKIIKVLFGETEGIVRCEAAILLKEIYEHQNIQKQILETVFSAMATVTTTDLHWEVKVNSLAFWEKVIDQHMSDQGMIDGAFPSVTFSKENRKIVTLTENEIKLRLHKVLEELARINCLMVLLSALKDHDLEVVRKAADIIASLKNVLSRHGLPADSLNAQDNALNNSRTNEATSVLDTFGYEASTYTNGKSQNVLTNAVISSATIDHDSSTSMCFDYSSEECDKVIDGIVNDNDINLLSSIYSELLEVEKKAASVSNDTKVSHKVIARDFLSAVASMNPRDIVEEKIAWLEEYSNNLESLLDDILRSQDKEANAMDCY